MGNAPARLLYANGFTTISEWRFALAVLSLSERKRDSRHVKYHATGHDPRTTRMTMPNTMETGLHAKIVATINQPAHRNRPSENVPT